jgi:hypothetical protein
MSGEEEELEDVERRVGSTYLGMCKLSKRMGLHTP